MRSRLTQLLHDEMILNGSLVTMARTCGNPRCKCAKGDKHVSLYLAIRTPKGRKMIYVPARLERIVRGWVDHAHEARQLLDQVSQACLQRFLDAKQDLQAGDGHAGDLSRKPSRS
jgi:hypothetical protein